MVTRPGKLSLTPSEQPSELQQATRSWLGHLRAEGRSVKTLYDRERNLLAIVLPHLAQQGIVSPTAVTSKALDRLAVDLADGGRSPATVATYMRDVKSFLRWLASEGDLERAPTAPKVAQPIRHPPVLSPAEYKHLVAVAEHQHPRDGLMVRIMGEAGLRVSELIGLREEDLLELSGGRCQLRVLGKGNKERLVSLPPDLGREVKRYLRRRPGAGRIFLSLARTAGEHRPLQQDGVTHLIERLGKTAEITKPVHPHMLRHTFATRAAAQGVDPLMLADQLGHTTLTMVRRYIQLSGQQKADRWDRIWKVW